MITPSVAAVIVIVISIFSKSKSKLYSKIIVIYFFLPIKIFSFDIFTTNTGEYLYYNVEQEDAYELMGVAHFNNELYRIRLFKAPKENIIIDLKHKIIEGRDRIVSTEVKYGKITKENLYILVSDLQKIFTQRSKIKNNVLEKNITIKRQFSVTGQGKCIYKYWIPCFQLYSFQNNSIKFTLIDYGRMKDSSDKKFYGYIWRKKEVRKIKGQLTETSLIGKKYLNMNYVIYSDWIKDIENNKTLSYILSKYTKQDAVFMLEKVNLRKINIDNILFFIKYYIILQNETIIPDSVLISNKDRTTLEFNTYNSDTKTITHQMSECIGGDNNIFYIVTLSVYYNLYKMNRRYFSKLFKVKYINN